MSDSQHCAVRKCISDSLLNQAVCFTVNGRCGLVKHYDSWVPKNSASHAEQLPFANAEVFAVLNYFALQLVRKVADLRRLKQSNAQFWCELRSSTVFFKWQLKRISTNISLLKIGWCLLITNMFIRNWTWSFCLISTCAFDCLTKKLLWFELLNQLGKEKCSRKQKLMRINFAGTKVGMPIYVTKNALSELNLLAQNIKVFKSIYSE